ncbi:MAG: DUF4421 domain-containing protein [Cyclobacteriaceae bacterium]|jgi:hypothetical protein|nr:DUF4421 domain-containing protein [Cyclobacteriaceae bacterium]
MIILLPLAVQAQEETDSLRAYYIEEFPDKFMVWPVLKQRDLYFTLRDRNQQKSRINYSPNNSFTFGIGAYLFDLLLEASFAIPLSEKSKSTYGESSARDFQANILAKKFAADIFYQKYSGFYIDDRSVNIPPGASYPQRPDVSIRNTGLNGAYVLNHRKFSLRSAFNYIDRQLHSRGSPLIGGALTNTTLQADSAVISTRPPGDLGSGSDFRVLTNTTLAITGGYSYTFIYKNYFINGTLVTGPGKHWIRYETDSVDEFGEMTNLITTIRLGIGYNSDRVFAGISYSAQSRSINFDDMRLITTTSTMRAVIGYRFNEFGFLKKRAVDFLPR